MFQTAALQWQLKGEEIVGGIKHSISWKNETLYKKEKIPWENNQVNTIEKFFSRLPLAFQLTSFLSAPLSSLFPSEIPIALRLAPI